MNTKKGQFEPAGLGKLIEKQFRGIYRCTADFFAGNKNCTDSVHKCSRAFLLCYESVQFLTPAKQMAAVSPYTFKHLFGISNTFFGISNTFSLVSQIPSLVSQIPSIWYLKYLLWYLKYLLWYLKYLLWYPKYR
jgi:hypothetical protein